MGAFYDFVKGKLKVDFSRDQLRTKIGRIKKRFLNALKKGGNGLDPVFSKPHEDMAFELSKKIWGVAVGNSEGGKTGDNAKKGILKAEKIGVDEKEIVNKEKEGGEQDFWSKYRFVNESFIILRELSLFGDVRGWDEFCEGKVEFDWECEGQGIGRQMEAIDCGGG
ncbi:UNVERIFIED_CONTAM: hypothetical protein Sradi_5239800 [Sesamum radiatum]|uniref:Glabrous enhancer-binding protein-like DBD domain-containing protein n=1 Tax=Sesamum radiatum TaxID=300843 RepID=A0AAW2LM53_SESRA